MVVYCQSITMGKCDREAVNRLFQDGQFSKNLKGCKKGVFYYRFGSKTRRFAL